MISYLFGKIIYKDSLISEKTKKERLIILEVNGIGFLIFISPLLLEKIIEEEKEKISLYTHLYNREDTLELYGFEGYQELDFFKELLTVSGIGPKSAMGILSLANFNEIKNAIKNEDINFLTKVSGVGKKTAEKIIIDLRSRLGEEKPPFQSKDSGDLIDALISLGYETREIRKILPKIPKELKTLEEKVKFVLKNLAR